MEDVVDHPQTTSSPEALAIHFLLRHAECRRALTGQTGEERPDAATEPRSLASVMQPAGTTPRPSEESLASNNAVTAGVTKDDSCTARFLRAYAAARHLEAGAEASDSVETATSQGAEDESLLKTGCQAR